MKKNREAGSAKPWIFLILLVFGGILGYRYGKIIFQNNEIQKQIEEVSDRCLLYPELDPKREIQTVLSIYEVVVDSKDINVEFGFDRDKVQVRFPYQRKWNLFVTNHKLNFEMNVERQAKKATGILRDVQQKVETSFSQGEQRYQKPME